MLLEKLQIQYLGFSG